MSSAPPAAASRPPLAPGRFAFPAMLAGSAALAFGPWLVRLADVGPVASAFWRLALAVPALVVLALLTSGRSAFAGAGRREFGFALLAAAGFAADLAVWHLGVLRTTLANATLLANATTFLLPLWGFVALGQRPGRWALLAMALAAAGMVLMVGQSAQMSARHLAGDLLCLAAAVFYTVYVVAIDRVRARMDALPTLALATALAACALLPVALNERFWPGDWTPLLALAFGSQVFGQGLTVYAVRHLSPVVFGLCLLIQPAISATVGALRFGEVPGPWELAGAALVVAALLLVRLPSR